MSEHLNPGVHPDADSLGAFLEGVLPEHERLACLAHFAQCPNCREIVFAAQEPAPAPPAPKPVPSLRGWFTPVAVLSGAAACALVVAVSLSQRHMPVAPGQDLVASVKPPAAPAPIAAAQPRAEFATAAVKKKAAPARGSSPAGLPSPISAPAPAPPPAMARNAEPVRPPATAPTAGPLGLSVQRGAFTIDGLAEIDGAVTDRAGAPISGATVTLGQLSLAPGENARTDANGKFAIPALPAGKYELRIGAPGFQSASGQIDLQAQDVATVAPVLSVGALSETVEVTASAGAAQTAPVPQAPKAALEGLPAAPRMSVAPLFDARATASPQAWQLPNKLPAVTTAAIGKLLLAADSAGALFHSNNAGKTWKTVKSVWPGKVVRLANLAESPGSRDLFQLTTDSGSIWLSQDGLHWRQTQ